MNLAMKLTFDGLVRALRLKAMSAQDNAELAQKRPINSGMATSDGEADDPWRGRPTEGAV